MKNLILLNILFFLFSCGKNTQDDVVISSKESAIPPYDTIAKDSFSAGAISVDIARQIRMSSQQYQDSIKEVRKKMEEERILKEEKDKTDKKLAEEKKITEDAEKAKKEKDKKTVETAPTETATNP
ncbi:MAG TPA: hypothetical protein PKC37_01135 [Kaistella sp.]|jgi:leucyl aminopeptidase (aminopeptidase T)|nr:hypothetical protein [Kaistella sp.]HOB24614.1 hypothetical protein [Kaistella sp.]HQD44447.1 hypothetical protein [Kaistella sp.]